MTLQEDIDRRRLLLELEIDGKLVESRVIFKVQYEWELKKLRLMAMRQRLPWEIFKTVARIRNK